MTLSIRRRLLLILLSVICGLWGTVTWRVYLKTQHEVEELFDAHLAQSAKVLFGLLQHEVTENENDEDDHETNIEQDDFGSKSSAPGHRYEHKIAFLIRNQQGQILARSNTAPLFPLPPIATEHFSDYSINQHLWRVFTIKQGQLFIQTGERYDIRNELIQEIVSSTLSILVIALPLLALLIWIGIGRSFQPLQRVATEIASRTSDQLQPLETKTTPLEIIVIINALNNLFTRLKQAFDNERRFTSDAAHELRTPLAGLKTQAQVAYRAIDSQQRQQALQQIIYGVDRATLMVSQLLTLARMEASQGLTKTEVNLHDLASQVITELAPQALAKAIDLGLEEPPGGVVTTLSGNPEALYLLIRNLIDNAIRYTPKEGQVTVSLENLTPSKVTLRVIDTGPGIPLAQRTRIFERFYRGDNQNIPGSGLGLSIAQQIAKLHQTEIQLEEVPPSLSGLRTRVEFTVI